jgi:hypothetical protein
MRMRACLLLFLLPACVAPARSATDYEHKAVDTAEAVLSSVETGSLLARLAPEQAFTPFVSVGLSNAEAGAASARAVFLSLQPPDARSDGVRAQLSPLLDRSDDALSRARISARRGDLGALTRSADELSATATSLERFIARFG